MRSSAAEFQGEIEAITERLGTLADGLAADGLLGASAAVLAARQTIRVLWTQLQRATSPPKLEAVPPEPEPAESAG